MLENEETWPFFFKILPELKENQLDFAMDLHALKQCPKNFFQVLHLSFFS